MGGIAPASGSYGDEASPSMDTPSRREYQNVIATDRPSDTSLSTIETLTK